jgi:hypothetical protein
MIGFNAANYPSPVRMLQARDHPWSMRWGWGLAWVLPAVGIFRFG